MSLRLVLLSLCTLALSAAEPVISVQVPNPGRSWERLQASVYARAAARPGAAPLLGLAQGQMRPLLQMFGKEDVSALMAAWDGAALRVAVDPEAGPSLAAWLGGADLAPQLFAMLAGGDSALAPPADASAVAVFQRLGQVAQFADGVAVATHGAAQRLDAGSDDTDLHVAFDWTAIELPEPVSGPGIQTGIGFLGVFLEMPERLPKSWNLSLVPEGLDHRLSFPRIPAGLVPVDLAVLDRIPADTTMVIAAGVDGAAWWQDFEQSVLPRMLERGGPEMAKSIQEGRAKVDQILAQWGVPGGISAVLSSMKGTKFMTVSTSGGILMPAITVGMPRSPELDAVVGALLAMTGAESPAEGKIQFVSIPTGQREFPIVAPGVVVARDASHWLVSTDALGLEDWLTGTTGGWRAQADLPQDLSSVQFVGWSNTPVLLRSLVPLVGPLVSNGLEQGRLAEASLELALGFAREAGNDVLIGEGVGAGWQLHGRGPLGGATVLVPNVGSSAVLAGLLLPAIGSARNSARRAQSMNNMKQLIMCSFAYQTDNDQRYPLDFDEMNQATGNELPNKIFYSPLGNGRMDDSTRYVYIRATPNAKSMQPIIFDPIRDGGKLLVTYADGHVATLNGPIAEETWAKAQELLARPETRAKGASPQDWGLDLLGRQ
ncbi:MAG: hypothetical protein PF961_23450 [Planctomycetota bacterium]|jgi:hypothetical protein|nr:hypothetical protein [Planctomycetota bacterium]